MATEELQQRVSEIPFWYHRIELPGGVVTPGNLPISAEAYHIPEDLTGKRVLDVGAWDGYWTFEALKRGASEVLAIDDFSDIDNYLTTHRDQHWVTFDLCREAFGYTDEQCPRREMSLYDVSPETVGMFDVVLFLGVLYHQRYPLLALDKMMTVCSDEIYVEGAILDNASVRMSPGYYSGEQQVMEFYPGTEYGLNPTNWWVPTLSCLGSMLVAAGFLDVEAWKLMDQPTAIAECRGFATGHRYARRANDTDEAAADSTQPAHAANQQQAR